VLLIVVVDVEVDPRAADVLAEQARRARLLDRRLEALDRLDEFAANVVETDRRTDAEAGDGHALDDLVRVVAQDVAVLAGARLALVGVAQDVLLPGRGARHEAPLDPGREARATTTAQHRRLELVDDLFRGQLTLEDLLPARVATDRTVVLQRVRLVEVTGAETDFVGHALLQALEQLVELLRRQVLDVAIAVLQHRRVGARTEALDFLERDAAVGRGLAEADTEPLALCRPTGLSSYIE
jgi:hypothetical protein